MAVLKAVLIATFVYVATAAQTVNNVRHTFYGYPDNTPAGPAIAYDCGRGYVAGGTGSYNNPHTMASAPGEFSKCEIIWDPYTRKYLRFEDTCGTCTTQWDNNRRRHIDIWLGPTNQNDHQKVINCELALTPDDDQPIVRDPPKNHQADSKLGLCMKQVLVAIPVECIHSELDSYFDGLSEHWYNIVTLWGIYR